jgi:hypothetical protein
MFDVKYTSNSARKMPPKHEDHILLQPSAMASVGLLGVGGGIGLALMLAKVLIVLGFAITVLSALAVFWVYARALQSLYRAITKRIPYKGPAVLEVVFACSAALLLLGVGSAVFPIVVTHDAPTGRALLNLIGIQRVKIPASAANGLINVEIKNQGNLDAERLSVLVSGKATATLLGPEAVKDVLDGLSKALDRVEASKLGNQLRPGVSAIVSLQDIVPEQWPAVLKGTQPPPIQISDGQWQDFEQARLAIYVFYIARYEDEAHPGKYSRTTNCMYFLGTTAFWHNCSENRIDSITK